MAYRLRNSAPALALAHDLWSRTIPKFHRAKYVVIRLPFPHPYTMSELQHGNNFLPVVHLHGAAKALRARKLLFICLLHYFGFCLQPLSNCCHRGAVCARRGAWSLLIALRPHLGL